MEIARDHMIAGSGELQWQIARVALFDNGRRQELDRELFSTTVVSQDDDAQVKQQRRLSSSARPQ